MSRVSATLDILVASDASTGATFTVLAIAILLPKYTLHADLQPTRTSPSSCTQRSAPPGPGQRGRPPFYISRALSRAGPPLAAARGHPPERTSCRATRPPRGAATHPPSVRARLLTNPCLLIALESAGVHRADWLSIDEQRPPPGARKGVDVLDVPAEVRKCPPCYANTI